MKKLINKLRLKSKITAIIVISVVPILITVFILFYIQAKTITENINQNIEVAKTAIKNSYKFYQKQAYIYAKMLAEDLDVQRGVNFNQIGLLRDALPRTQAEMEELELDLVIVHNRDKKILYQSHFQNQFNIEDKENQWINTALGGTSSFATIPYHHYIVMLSTVPIFQQSGNLSGEVVIGTLTTGCRMDIRFLRSLKKLSGVNTLLFSGNSLIATSFGSPLDPYLGKMFTNDTTVLINHRDFDLGGIQITTDQFQDLKLVVAVDNEELKTTLINLVLTLGIVSFFVVLMALYIAIQIANNITNNTRKIIVGSQEVANENFDIHIDVDSNDELKDLANTFNVMAVHIKNSFAQIKEYSENLEGMVADRTRELSEANIQLSKAFEEVTTLKIQQDGDYFLTSLLIEPLLINEVRNPNLKIEFYLSQKKKFTFQNRDSEIGGDICIAQELTLNNVDGKKKYTIFTNGDAMGKSIQGAGGSLVFGVVFNSFINRTHRVRAVSRLSPEEWLSTCYQELQSVFESFDGSMLVSAVLGIIDNETGMMYYFNAEHPWVCLYRNKKAVFIETELLNRKIGTLIGDGKVAIRAKQLLPGDVIIIGSDGRDDVLIGNDKSGQRIINENETLFLDSIQAGNGDLYPILDHIQSRGELTDDISLIRINFLETSVTKTVFPQSPDEGKAQYEAYIKNKNKGFMAFKERKWDDAIAYLEKATLGPKDLQCFEKLITAYKKKLKYQDALTTAKESLKHFPSNIQIFYQISMLHKKMKQYDESIYYGRRFYHYYPKHIVNLINLADSYRMIKDYEKAKITLDEAERLDPSNEIIIKLKQMLKQRGGMLVR